MEHVSYASAVKHEREGLSVYQYPMQNGAMNMAVAEIGGRYPDFGYAINHKSDEMGYILKGTGKFVTESSEVALSEGDVVYFPKGEKYYWEGNLTIVVCTSPAWNLKQHEVNLDGQKIRAL